MEAILLELLHRIATSRDLVGVNLAAGMAYEQLMERVSKEAGAKSPPTPTAEG